MLGQIQFFDIINKFPNRTKYCQKLIEYVILIQYKMQIANHSKKIFSSIKILKLLETNVNMKK